MVVMSTITVPKTEYKVLKAKAAKYDRIVESVGDEVVDQVKAKLERQSHVLDRQPGKRFKSIGMFRQYLKTL